MDWLVVLGLSLNAVGALSVVVPDLEPSTRSTIVARLPVVGGMQRATSRLPSNNSGVEGPRELEDITMLWPAIREYENVEGLDTTDMEGLRPSGSRSFRIKDSDGRTLYDGRFDDVRVAATAYVDRRLHAWGFSLLTVGFLVQLVGLLLG